MECNRDEAIRAKSIAEGKLEKKDFAGAKKFAVKAHTLFPGLDGILHMLATLDVYISAENRISGEVDWYGVLAISPSADDETIRKQYRKLALMLHPDKNKSVGAEGAFKLISEAWTLLSDKTRRLAYNQRRGLKGFQHVPLHNGGTTAPRANGYYNFANKKAPVPKAQNNNVRVPSSSASAPSTESVPKTQNNNKKVPPSSTSASTRQRSDTFWTICHRCKMHYEYVKIYRNSTLLCPNCKEAFIASETDPPFNYSKATKQLPRQRQQNIGNQVSSRNASDQAKNVKKSGPGQPGLNPSKSVNIEHHSVWGTTNVASTDPSIAVKADGVVQQAQDKVKRSHNESHASTVWDTSFKKRKLDDSARRFEKNYNVTVGHGGVGTSNASVGSKAFSFSGIDHQMNSTRVLTPAETHSMLLAKARKEIWKKLNEWQSEELTKPAVKDKAKTKASKKQMRGDSNKLGHDDNGNTDLSATKKAEPAGKRLVNCVPDNGNKQDSAVAPMDVPDSDFHNFDLDRTENSFEDNDVWAAYDDDDGMPRFYALISKVVSRKQFKLKISWLNSRTNREFCTTDWVGSGFYKTCGEFRVGKYETCKFINAFSQKVSWMKGPHGSILILPKKGDVWALYKNWSSDWNGQTPDEVIHDYDMVIVLDDYSDEKGVSVTPLVKLNGFRTVFCQKLGPEVILRIPKEEMLRFSHQVPSHLLTGQEARNSPAGCLELDPAATPLELLQVATEAGDVLQNEEKEKVSEKVPKSFQGTG